MPLSLGSSYDIISREIYLLTVRIMIRKLKESDINKVADIWLNTNLTAHGFIPAQYWKRHFETVKEMLLCAEVYVYEDENEVQGFVGLSDDYIEGIFVCAKVQSNGIGKKLLDFVKNKKTQLKLSVYQKNIRAIEFYQREHFKIQSESTDTNTGEKEYVMIWKL